MAWHPPSLPAPGGYWRFPREDMETLKLRVKELQAQNRHKTRVKMDKIGDRIDTPLC